MKAAPVITLLAGAIGFCVIQYKAESAQDPNPTLEEAYRAWHKALSSPKKEEREAALRSMLPMEKDIATLFPKHADKLWQLFSKVNTALVENADSIAKDFTHGGEVEKIKIINVRQDKDRSEGTYKKLLAIIPNDVAVCDIVVTTSKGASGGGTYICLEKRWFFIKDMHVLPEILEQLDAKGKSRGPVTLTDAAKKIHAEALLIDGHNDLPWKMREKTTGFTPVIDIAKPQPKMHTDIARLRQGNVGAQFWSAYVPADSMKKGTSIKLTMEQIDLIHRMVAKYPDVFEMASTADDILRIRKQGKIASMIGVEGGHSIDNSLGVLRTYYALGVRYMTLTHSDNLDWADSATDAPKLKGLSPFGERVVQEMNRLGMLVDISHISADTMRHTLKVAKAPVIASHSSAYAIAEHPRNVPDDVLKLVKQNGGVIMVNFYSAFVVPEGARAMKDMFKAYRDLKEKYKNDQEFQEAYAQWQKSHPVPAGTVHDVVDHLHHIVKVAGIDHVGLGSDYDGIGLCPKQLEDVSCYPYITQVLLDRGYNREEIHKILGGNVLRAMREAEQVAKNMK